MLQEAAMLAKTQIKVLYVSGEESLMQTKMRADRLGLSGENLFVLTENNLESIISEVDQVNPQLVIIDSILMMAHIPLV